MDIHKFREQLDRYLKGRTNETETAIIEAWYRSYNNEANQPMTDDAREQMRLDMKQQIGKAIGRSSNNWGFYRIAACLLVFSALGALAYLFTRPKDALKTTFVTIQTQAGQIKQFVLPDSSVIWVNAASKVRVPSRFNDNLRQVYLDEDAKW